jgi:hypothetical protein
LECTRTILASSKTLEKIRSTLEHKLNPPTLLVQKYAVEECKKGNLVWIHKNKITPEPHETELLLGFLEVHIRGMNIIERRASRLRTLISV